jgi:hypothetical protein
LLCTKQPFLYESHAMHTLSLEVDSLWCCCMEFCRSCYLMSYMGVVACIMPSLTC